MEDIIISLDIGTTVVKSVTFSTNCHEVNIIEIPCKTFSPTRNYNEQDPEDLWNKITKILKTAVRSIKSNQRIQAVTITTQGGSVVPVDREGNSVYNIITWMDSRAAKIIEDWIKDGTSDRIRSISGWTPQPGLPLPVIAWLYKFKQDIFHQAQYWLSINDYITHKLTGVYATNPSMAGEMLLTDIRTGQWNEELCQLAGVRPEQLSPILPSGKIMGGINKSCSMATGLMEGTPVINAGQDHACEALALGLVESDSAFLACGTAWVINGITNSGLVDNIPQRMDLNFHVLPNRWIASQFLGNLGTYPEWCLTQFWTPAEINQSTDYRYQQMNEALRQIKDIDENLLFLPFSGSNFNQFAANSGGFFGLQFNHTISHLCFAVMESAGFEVTMALQELTNDNNSIQELWMIGGASRSPVWPQILADINGIDILITSYNHGPALGAAILAWLALGYVSNLQDYRNIIKLNYHRFKPDFLKKEIYNRKIRAYQRLATKYKTLSALA